MRPSAGPLALGICLALHGAVARAEATAPPPGPEPGAEARVQVPARAAWTRTGIAVEAGEVLELAASGRVRISGFSWFGREGPDYVDPDGTYLLAPDEMDRVFPLAAGDQGPAPAFALLGRVGDDGEPFLVGRGRQVRMPRPGELELGLNDFDPSDNRGAHEVRVRRVERGAESPFAAVDARPAVAAGAIATGALPAVPEDAHVLVLFVDGLRYDALAEMAFAGHLPNLRRIFFDGGVDVERTFTISPSDTVPATVAFLSGSWPDRNGVSTQVLFDREAERLHFLLSPYGPAEVASRFEPQGWKARHAGPRPPRLLSGHVEQAGHRFASTVLPVLSAHPPDRYLQRLMNVMPLLGSHRVKDEFVDRSQTSYAVDEVVKREHKVMMIWYSSVDTAGHRSPRGLWGTARNELAKIDRDLARLEQALRREGIAERTYLVLWADHGSSGGKTFLPRSYDLADHFFYRPLRDDDGDGRLDADAGLGMNVHYLVEDVPLVKRHSDLPARDFAVCAAQAYSVARIALPRGGFDSRDWSVPNGLAELTRYRLHPDLAPVDVLERLLSLRLPGATGAAPGDRPVGLILVPLPPDRVLLLGQQGTWALIERRPAPGGPARRFEYRYLDVRRLTPTAGGVEVETASHFSADPLGYVREPALRARLAADPDWLGRWRDDRAWLEATAEAEYPDAVVAFAHQLLPDPGGAPGDPRARFDLTVIASQGWNFGAGAHRPGVDHGGPHRDARHVPFLIAGPGLPRGVRVTRPVRTLDILPTILELASIPYDESELDGRPVREIWSAGVVAAAPRPIEPVANAGLQAPPVDPPRTPGPPVVHNFSAWYDPHNLASNLGSITNQELVRLTDRLVDAVVPGPPHQPLDGALDALGGAWGRLPEGRLKRRPAELVEALRLHHVTLGELVNPVQSLQNVDRVALTLEWAGRVLNDPFPERWPYRLRPVMPLDFALGKTAQGLLVTRRTLERTAFRLGDWALRRTEAGVRFAAGWVREDGMDGPRLLPPEAERVADEVPAGDVGAGGSDRGDET